MGGAGGGSIADEDNQQAVRMKEQKNRTKDEIEKKRRQIDRMDITLVGLLARRARLAREIGERKRMLGLSLSDSKREKQVLERIKLKAEAIGLEPDFIGAIAKKIIAYCKREQKK